MRNFVQPGRMIGVTAPAAVASGDGVLIGALFGVAASDAASGAAVEIATEGVFDLPKATGGANAFTVGAAVEWNAAAARLAAHASGVRIGVVVAAAGADAATARVRLG